MSENDWRGYYKRVLDEEQLSRLDAFVGAVLKLRESRYLARNGRLEHVTEVVKGEAVSASDHGDAEQLHSLLMKLRKLLMDKEPTFINRVVSDLIRHEPDADRVQRLRESYQEIKKARKDTADGVAKLTPSGAFQVERGRTNERALREVLNGQLFHSDPTTDDDLLPLPDVSGPDFGDENFIEVLQRQNLIDHILDECNFAIWLYSHITSAK